MQGIIPKRHLATCLTGFALLLVVTVINAQCLEGNCQNGDEYGSIPMDNATTVPSFRVKPTGKASCFTPTANAIPGSCQWSAPRARRLLVHQWQPAPRLVATWHTSPDPLMR
ncbi:MAG: hypothetical protein R2795_25795 [Saprospiraceae bacterium]